MIAFSDVQENVRRLAQIKPEEQTDCAYFNDDGTPCCIFGHIIHDLGALSGDEKHQSWIYIKNTFFHAQTSVKNLDWGKFDVRPPSKTQLAWAKSVQVRQDCGASWGEAVAQADEKYYPEEQ